MNKELGVSLIMPSYLGEYPGSRSNPVDKFIRAVKSFLDNNEVNKELIIVSDGCQLTNDTYNKLFKNENNIRLITVEKSEFAWPGELRECGRSIAKYDWIGYLDADDYILPFYIKSIVDLIKKYPDTKVFKNNQMFLPILSDEELLKSPRYLDIMPWSKLEDFKKFRESSDGIRVNFLNKTWVLVKVSKINGTWSFVHNKYVSVRWRNSKEMGEDVDFLINLGKEYEINYVDFPGYVICHITNVQDRSQLVYEV